MFRHIILIITLGMSAPVLGYDLDDTEDLTNESDAAAAETKAVKQEIEREKAKANRAYSQASKEHKAAVAKRQKAANELKRSEAEIEKLNAERAKLLSEVERLDRETAAIEKTTTENKAQADKLQAEIQTIQQIRAEKATRFIEISGERDKILESIKMVEQQHAQADQDLQKSKEQEKLAASDLEKTKLEHAQKKARLDAYLAGLKERYREAQERLKAMENEKSQLVQNTHKLEAQAKAGEAEVQQAELELTQPDRGINSATVASENQPAEVKFRKKCRVFAKPIKGAKVLAIQKTGAKVSKSDEGKTWIAFPLADGRTGYAAKTCF